MIKFCNGLKSKILLFRLFIIKIKIFGFLNIFASNVGRPLETVYDEETEEMVLKVHMNKDQYNIYIENFVIMRENKKRRDETFITKKLGNVQKE